MLARVMESGTEGEGAIVTVSWGSRDQFIEDRTMQLRNLGLSDDEIAEYEFDADLEQEPFEDTKPPETPPSVRQREPGDWASR